MAKGNGSRITVTVHSPKSVVPNRLVRKSSSNQNINRIYECLRTYCPEFVALAIIVM